MPLAAAIPLAAKVAKKVPVVGGAIDKVLSIGQNSDPKEDRKRDARTDAEFNKAVGGDWIAIAYLRARGAKVPAVNIPGQGKVGNWPGDHAKNYARQKYLQIEAMPQLASQVARAKQLWTGQGLPETTLTGALSGTVGTTGIPVWLLVAGALAVGVGLWLLLTRRR